MHFSLPKTTCPMYIQQLTLVILLSKQHTQLNIHKKIYIYVTGKTMVTAEGAEMHL
jgi:hypothetical protein